MDFKALVVILLSALLEVCYSNEVDGKFDFLFYLCFCLNLTISNYIVVL